MLSVTLDSSGSPKKRTYSRGISEDESLRSIIKETESSTRRLTRSDSRAGTLKKRTDSQQSDQDLLMGLPEMLELQASYDEAVQELHGLEVEREALLFQVDVLQDTLEGVEELLAEAQREAGQVNLELEQERVAKRKLESLVCSLMQEVERLKEEKNGRSAPVSLAEATGWEHQIQNNATQMVKVAQKEDKDSSLCESCRRAGGLAGAEATGSVPTKLRMVVNQPVGHLPSLAVDNLDSIDGVLRRPYKNHMEDGRDPSPDQNDTDSISAYEDASADTPEQDRIFPGGELPDDSEKNPADSCEVGSETQDPKNESCILS